MKKFESSEAISEKSTDKAVFSEFWEAPERFWRRDIEDAEITAILVSLHKAYVFLLIHFCRVVERRYTDLQEVSLISTINYAPLHLLNRETIAQHIPHSKNPVLTNLSPHTPTNVSQFLLHP